MCSADMLTGSALTMSVNLKVNSCALNNNNNNHRKLLQHWFNVAGPAHARCFMVPVSPAKWIRVLLLCSFGGPRNGRAARDAFSVGPGLRLIVLSAGNSHASGARITRRKPQASFAEGN
jgi:hypothetical protein